MKYTTKKLLLTFYNHWVERRKKYHPSILTIIPIALGNCIVAPVATVNAPTATLNHFTSGNNIDKTLEMGGGSWGDSGVTSIAVHLELLASSLLSDFLDVVVEKYLT